MTIEQALRDGWIFLYLSDSPAQANYRAFYGATNCYAKSVEELLEIIERAKRFSI